MGGSHLKCERTAVRCSLHRMVRLLTLGWKVILEMYDIISIDRVPWPSGIVDAQNTIPHSTALREDVEMRRLSRSRVVAHCDFYQTTTITPPDLQRWVPQRHLSDAAWYV